MEKSKEEMIKEAVEEAKKAVQTAEEHEEEVQDVQETEVTDDESVTEALETDSAEDEKSEKKKLFNRKPKKDKKDEQIEDLTDKLTRQMAEFDNYRKRTEKEKSSMYEIGAKSVIEKLLPVVDNFERGLIAVPEEKREDSFVTGMEMVYKQIMTMFETIGVKPIETVGQEFNPDLHNAVMHVEDENVGENIIVEEFQKGYTYKDSVVRYSMVKVAN